MGWRGPFVGRELELQLAHEALDDVLAGTGRLLLLAGEPGIGKSRLADELGAQAAAHGARLLWGRCWEAGGAPAYWPWVQSLRAYVETQDVDDLRAQLGPGAADLVQILPELREILGDHRAAGSAEAEGARFRLFDSTARFLRCAAAERPLMLVLDDLHAADASSLLMLRFVASQLTGNRLLVVAAYRDSEIAPHHPLSAALAELLREPTTRLLTLGSLEPAAVGRYIEQAAGIRPSEALVEAIHGESDGNPLFMDELIKLLVREHRLGTAPLDRLGVPQTVREVIGQRLRHLSGTCLSVLRAASILGREFPLDALARLARLDEQALLSVLDEAMLARVLTEVPDAPTRRRFSHALIRETLYEDIPPGRRPALHLRCGEVLEDVYGPDLEPHLTELAHHFFQAVPIGDRETAARYGRRAAERAVALLAFEEAARLYELALAIVEPSGSDDVAMRCELVLGLGDAQARAGDIPTAQRTFIRAAELARKAASPEQLARAALGYGGRFVWEAGRGDPHLVALLEAALRMLGDSDSPLRARVLARLAGGPLRDEPERARRAQLSREAVELARRLGDPATLAYALDGRYAAIWWPDNLEQRLGVATELVEVARRAGDDEREFQGRHYRCLALLELGDMPEVYSELAAQARLAEALRQQAQHWYVACVRATLATFEGRFAEADELVAQATLLARRAQGSMADAYSTIQSYLLRMRQGRIDEIEHRVLDAVAAYPTYRVLRSVAAHLHAQRGEQDEARQALEQALPADPADLGFDDEWLFSASLLADVADHVGDTARAAMLYDALLPYAQRNAGSNPDGCIGSVSRPLGVLAATLGRFEQAVRHFEDAIAMNTRTGGRPWVAETRLDHARALLARSLPGDRERATELLASVLATARELGAAGLEVKASELQVAATAPAAGRAGCVLRHEGEYWMVAGPEGEFRLKHSKGLRYLAELLANPGREVAAIALASVATGDRATPPVDSSALADDDLHGFGMGDTGPAIDVEAKAAYRRRLEDLHVEIDEAERFNDTERLARRRAEHEFVASELAAAVGLGGRARRLHGPEERARQSVTKAIRSAIDRISAHSPELGEHLAGTVRTGTSCTYEPGPRAAVTWRL